ncbi:uncharacterized protein BP01DRAFT_262721, partial [Aspergillus saccharolyticus JOP 1030-1]
YRKQSVPYFHGRARGGRRYPRSSYFAWKLQYAFICWTRVADHIRSMYSKDSLKVLPDQELYYESVDTVDTVYSGNHTPSLKQYLSRCQRTAGVYQVIATIPWVAHLFNKTMQLLWKHTSYLVYI